MRRYRSPHGSSKRFHPNDAPDWFAAIDDREPVKPHILARSHTLTALRLRHMRAEAFAPISRLNGFPTVPSDNFAQALVQPFLAGPNS
jgi:hypothetical protein